ncbi:hypothetical protein [Ketogulonicigenium robustum]|uniref:hypothetical protein n=1 Tax=Ketogulonicigenium robustum TaxID=92947 RepID=UPI000A267265|nr:hypothetical protein [Ketogulonicigenium robustum]
MAQNGQISFYGSRVEYLSAVTPDDATSGGTHEPQDREAIASHLMCTLLEKLKYAERGFYRVDSSREIQGSRRRGQPHGRPKSMTPERALIAESMISAGHASGDIWKIVSAMSGPTLGRSTFYAWKKGQKAAQNRIAIDVRDYWASTLVGGVAYNDSVRLEADNKVYPTRERALS